MAQRASARPDDDSAEQAPLTARDVVELARDYAVELTQLEAVGMTSLQPTEPGGWLVEIEILEQRRIPSSSDILALYVLELDHNGELLSYRRTRRYLRGHTENGTGGGLE